MSDSFLLHVFEPAMPYGRHRPPNTGTINFFLQCSIKGNNSTNDINENLDLFNSMFTSCLDRHASLRKIRVTHPPVPC